MRVLRPRHLTRVLRSRFSQSADANARPDQMTSDVIRQILRFPTKDIVTTESSKPPEVIPKKKPESIFELNKSKLDDIYSYFLEVGNIEEVNRKFGTAIREFRYGLPLPNIDPGFKNIEQLIEELNPTPLTAVENLYNELALNGDSSYEEYESAIQKRFNFYNLLGEADDNDPETLALYDQQREIAIPVAKLKNEKHMLQIRKTFEINFNMPGCVELIDPNRFIEGLRPVEDFRHTPLIPISKAEMDRFEEKKRKRKEEPYHIVYTREKVFTVFMFGATAVVIFLFFRFAMDVEESMFVDYRRTKLKRLEESFRNKSIEDN
jgi:hypothetical protein